MSTQWDDSLFTAALMKLLPEMRGAEEAIQYHSKGQLDVDDLMGFIEVLRERIEDVEQAAPPLVYLQPK